MLEIKQYKGKKPIIDVPVRVNIWIRPNCQKQQWDVIKMAKPSILFIQSDGGRSEEEWNAICQNRKMIDESIDWECTVYRFYEDHNNGLYSMGKKVQSYIWEKVDRCIFLEDDQIPSLSFFRFCSELLEKYKDDQRIECICGMNHLGVWKSESDYFFSRQGSIWGTATWKRVFAERENGFVYSSDTYVMNLLKQRTRRNKTIWKRLINYSKSDIFEGHPAGGEFWKEFDMYSQNRLQIIPKKNMIRNIGLGKESAHAKEAKLLPKSVRKIFNLETFEMTFPMKHAEYVIPDIEYERKRNKIMHYNLPPISRFFDNVIKFFKYLFLGTNPFKKAFQKKKTEK